MSESSTDSVLESLVEFMKANSLEVLSTQKVVAGYRINVDISPDEEDEYEEE